MTQPAQRGGVGELVVAAHVVGLAPGRDRGDRGERESHHARERAAPESWHDRSNQRHERERQVVRHPRVGQREVDQPRVREGRDHSGEAEERQHGPPVAHHEQGRHDGGQPRPP